MSRRILLGLVALLCLAVVPAFGASVVYNYPLDSDPGWTRDAQWGLMSGEDCCIEGAHTGSYYFNISPGIEYPADMSMQYLTTSVINCSGLSEVYLRYYAQFGRADYDTSTIEVSTNGSTWTTIWSDSGAGYYYSDWEE
jgi:hypothetical protein